MCFVLLGFSFLLTGVDAQKQDAVVSNFTATDLYLYNWNATFNQSSVANVSTTMNKTVSTNYLYHNETNEYTRLFAIISIFLGLAVGFEAMASRRKNNDDSQ